MSRASGSAIRSCLWLAFVSALPVCGTLAEAPYSGGQATTFDRTMDAFGQPIAGLSDKERRRFASGNRLFKLHWVVAPAS